MSDDRNKVVYEVKPRADQEGSFILTPLTRRDPKRDSGSDIPIQVQYEVEVDADRGLFRGLPEDLE